MFPSNDTTGYPRNFLGKGTDSSLEWAALSRPRWGSVEKALSWGFRYKGSWMQEGGSGFLCFKAGSVLLNFIGDCKLKG